MRPSLLRVLLPAVLVATAGPAAAQQNLFSVPTARQTPENRVFFQQQLSLTGDDALQSDTTIDFGVRDWLEVGVNLMNVEATAPGDLPESDEAGRAQVLGNVSVGGELAKGVAVQAGVQLGGALRAVPGTSPFVANGWAAVRSDLGGLKFLTGGYVGTLAARGVGSPAGLMLGAKVPVLAERFDLVGEAIFGTNEHSLSTFGGSVHLTDEWSLTAGWQLPSPGSDNDQGGVVQLTRQPQ